MPTRRIATAHCLTALTVFLVASSAQPKKRPATTGFQTQVVAEPWKISGLDVRTRARTRAAFRQLHQVLDKERACSALFEGLNTSARETVEKIRYRSATSRNEPTCRPGVAAFTKIRGTTVVLCVDTFPTLDRDAMTTLFLHEGLHIAGLGEKPSDPNGLTSQEINHWVGRECGL